MSEKLVLEYPCVWRYKLITESDIDINKIISSILKDRISELDTSKTSQKGSYKSYSLSLTIKSDEDRKDILEKLREHKTIKFVL